MGRCCGKGGGERIKDRAPAKDEKFQPGGEFDLSEGLIRKRRCTDVYCIVLFLLAQVGFLMVTIAGLADGHPSRLYYPRDYRGAYCGMEENWNGGPNTQLAPKLSYTLNVSAVVEQAATQAVCSSVAMEALVTGSNDTPPLLENRTDQLRYLCDCCLIPCGSCDSSFDTGGDLSTPEELVGMVWARMAELTDPTRAADLFDSSRSMNAETLADGSFWDEATKYFNSVCLPDCHTDYTTIPNKTAANNTRSYTYIPAPDDRLYFGWATLLDAPDSNILAAPLKFVLDTAFTFQALPDDECPYDAELCVPAPGVQFSSVAIESDYCTFELATEVIEVVGGAAASAFESLGGSSFKASASETAGMWVGDFQKTVDSFIIVSLLAFVVGLTFLILLRFCIGVCVWGALFATIVLFFVAGGLSFVRSGQCSGDGIAKSGQRMATGALTVARAAAVQAANGGQGSDESLDASGYGAEYRGVQDRTKTGLPCLDWATQERYPEFRPRNYNESDLVNNYCRNPYHAGDEYKAKTIWCITADPATPWEECEPIGIVQSSCPHGYAVQNAGMRDTLKVIAVVVWLLGLIWSIGICCLASRIRLAIALNKVAAVFVATNPKILLVPIVQTLVAIAWTIIWLYAASFLISQVPETYTPTGYYATYEEAYGVDSTCGLFDRSPECQGVPGACTDKWPTGFVWKDTDCEFDVATGVALCWRCAPPRYIVDIRFAASFFVFLWNNSFNVALGQCIVAFATGIWFFSREKGKVSVVRSAIRTVFRYHLGSVALGSFIVALVQFLRWMLEFAKRQAGARKNKCMVMTFRALQCCLWCFEKIVQFINKNAYIQIALLGKPFCISAKTAFFLILRNWLRYGTLTALGGVIRFIGYFFIVVGTVMTGFCIVRAMHDDVSPVFPLVCFFLVATAVARLFMTVFSLAVDTCMQCFLAVEEMGTGKEVVPKVLQIFVTAATTKKAKKDTEDDDDTEDDSVEVAEVDLVVQEDTAATSPAALGHGAASPGPRSAAGASSEQGGTASPSPRRQAPRESSRTSI